MRKRKESIMKKYLSLVLMVLLLLSVPLGLASCGEMEDSGAVVNLYYLGETYDFDPARVLYDDDAMRVSTLLFEPLFTLNEKGKVEPALAESYKILRDTEENLYQMEITLRKTSWSDGNPVKAEDVVYSWQRIIEPDFKCDAAPLLYNIEGAIEVKNGDLQSSVGDFKVTAEDADTLTITFRNVYDEDGNVVEIDYDAFLRNLTSPALAPVRQAVVSKATEYWGRNSTTIVTSGPFTVRTLDYDLGEFTLERNMYYNYPNKDMVPEGERPDKHVRPYQLITTWKAALDELGDLFADESLFLMSDMPVELREQYKKDAKVTDVLSTMSILFNLDTPRPGSENGIKKAEVRKALSQALDREAIADLLVFAEPATGFVSHGVFETDSRRDTFRENAAEGLLSKNADLTAAKAVTDLVPNAAKQIILGYADSDSNRAVAEYVQEVWGELGFNVTLRPLGATEWAVFEDGTLKLEKDISSAEKQNVKYHFRSPDILDLYEDFVLGDKTQALAEYNALGTYEKNNYWSATPNRIANVKFFDAILIDLQMLSPDAFAPLAAFSTVYGGQGVDLSLNADGTQRETSEIHVTGYNKAEYDALIEEAFLTRDAEARAAILHEAEEMLLDDMPIIPLTFGQAHYVKSRKLRNIDTTYYGYPILTDMKLKNYQKYLPEEGEN